MKAKLIVEDKEFPIEIQYPELQKLLAPSKKTGYERVGSDDHFFCEYGGQAVRIKSCDDSDKSLYTSANYYSNEIVAKNNTRADKLMRQLRRFAVEHRENNNPTERYSIYYVKNPGILQLRRDETFCFCAPWFDSQHTGAQAIKAFKDELIWYFTEYKDSL